jgi:adenine-specific DNA-methyltransferase
MISKKQKLELTWIGKENRPRLEPRILLEGSEAFDHGVDNSIYNDQNEHERRET